MFVVNNAEFFLSHRLPLGRAAKEAGMEVHVATPDSPAAERIVSEGLRFHPIPLSRSGMHPLRELRTLIALIVLFHALRPDIVHTVTLKPVLYGAVAARLAKVPALVSAISGMGYVFIRRGFRANTFRWFIRWIYRLALRHRNSRVIVQNPDDCAALLNMKIVDDEAVVTIRGSGTDLTVFHPTPEPAGTQVVLLASRMLWDKGVGEFVEAAKRLRARGVLARFVLVGNTDPGNPATIAAEQLQSWRDSGVVEWWGRCTDMAEVFAQCHVVCLPSYREGLPKVLIEAASCGRPIVTTDVPGCREVVRHGINGLLVPARDTWALELALAELIADAQRRAHMGEAGRKLVEHEFAVEQVVTRTLSIYQKLLT